MTTECEACEACEACDALPPEIAYINFPDGTELQVEMPKGATLRELYSRVCSIRTLPMSRLQLIPFGETKPLERSPEKLIVEVLGETRQLMAVVSRHMDLGQGSASFQLDVFVLFCVHLF